LSDVRCSSALGAMFGFTLYRLEPSPRVGLPAMAACCCVGFGGEWRERSNCSTLRADEAGSGRRRV
jgi:hypothetical protein